MNLVRLINRPAARSLPAFLLLLALLTACRSGTATPTGTSATSASPTTRASVATITPRSIATPLPATPVVTKTEVQVVKPFTDIGLAIGYTRTESVVGRCIGPSLASTGRSDAWRCTIYGTNELRDPCIAQGDSRQPALVCLRQPWASGVAIFVLTEPLPEAKASAGDPTAPHPWGLELADGTRCVRVAGTPAATGAQRITSTCNGTVTTIGEVDRSQPVWTIQVVQGQNSQPERKQIAKAWY